MLRITSGTAKNKKIIVPEVEGIRPVQEIVKLAIFSILGDRVEEARVLDLFAGSGNLGLEALSRGAAWCDFVDSQWIAKQVIMKNIKNMGFDDRSEVHLSESVKFVGNTSNKYDVIFVDPFYEDLSQKFLVKNLEEVLNPDGTVIFLHGEKLDMNKLIDDTKLEILSERKFGKSFLTVLSRSLE